MITITSNLGAVAARLKLKTEKLIDNAYVKDQLLRTIATTLTPVIAQRIHIDGKNAEGNQIGEYSNPYMRVRARNKRDASKRVIFSLTRQMENDFSPIATDNGYGIGFKNPLNAQKASWLTVEGVGKNKKIFPNVYKLSQPENELVVKIEDQFIKDTFK